MPYRWNTSRVFTILTVHQHNDLYCIPNVGDEFDRRGNRTLDLLVSVWVMYRASTLQWLEEPQ